MNYHRYGYSRQDLDGIKVICYDSKICVTKFLHIHVIYWYHLYIKQPGGYRISNATLRVCYLKVLVKKVYLYVKTFRKFQYLNKHNT